MSIALHRTNNNNSIQRSDTFIHGMSYASSFMASKLQEEEQHQDLDSCTSSSIGRNSDLSNRSSDGDAEEDTEVQSSYKGPLDTMDALEEVLPIRRGISKFYCGKSKSYTSLACAASASMKEIAKPENAYNKRRKNMVSGSINFGLSNRNLSPRTNGGGISKRPTMKSSLSLSTLAYAVAMSSSESLNTSDESTSNSTSPSSPHCLLPPLHPQRRPSFHNLSSASPPLRPTLPTWRSYSMVDLQCENAAPTKMVDNNVNHY